MKKLLLAPLQGFTDINFRNAWHQHFDGIDQDYAPYIALQNDGTVKKSQWRDIMPDDNVILPVPQILPSSVSEAEALTEQVLTIGAYKHININMGCPYPMVTNRGRGSGLLPQPQLVDEILSALFTKFSPNISFSVKMRCGLEDIEEMKAIFKVLEAHKLDSIILHPRLGKQLYKGNVHLDAFEEALSLTSHKLYYNGDITTLEEYNTIVERFPTIAGVMLGRGLLQNPLLATEIKTGEVLAQKEKLELFEAFHETLFNLNAERLSGDSHLINKMKSYAPYFAHFNIENKKAFKQIKKAQSSRSYAERIQMLFRL